MCVLKLQLINHTTVIVTHIPNFAAYVYHWWWARLDCCCHLIRYNDHLKCSAGKIWIVDERQPFSPRATQCSWQVQIHLGPVPWRPKWTYDQHTVIHAAIAPSTRQPINAGLAEARPNYSSTLWRYKVRWATMFSGLSEQRKWQLLLPENCETGQMPFFSRSMAISSQSAKFAISTHLMALRCHLDDISPLSLSLSHTHTHTLCSLFSSYMVLSEGSAHLV